MSISLTANGLTLTASGSATFSGGISFPFGGLPNAKFVNGYFSGSSTGDNDVYTVPAGRRAFITMMYALNTSGVAGGFQMKIKIGGTYYPLSTGTGASVGNNGNAYMIAVVPYVAEAGEVLAMNATQQPFTTWAAIIEFDDTATLKSSKITSFVNGNNTVYTAPASTTAMLVSQALLTSPTVTQAGDSPSDGASTFCYCNVSGASRTISWNLVPSGGSVGATNNVSSGTLAAGNNSATYFGVPLALSTGDFVNINSNSNASGQLAWVTVVEL